MAVEPVPSAHIQAEVEQLQIDTESYRVRIADLEAQNERQQSEIDYLLTQVKPKP
jgi:hypothetical protein